MSEPRITIQLIRSYDIKLATPDCFPGAAWFRVNLNLHNDITEVLPYLNAELEGADYNHDTKILLWNSGEKKYAFRPHEIIIAPVHDREEAEELAHAILRTVNEIWIRRDKIEPKFEGKKPLPSVLDIFKLLPRTSCRECGYLTCMAFAAALRSDPAKLSLCSYISELRTHNSHQS